MISKNNNVLTGALFNNIQSMILFWFEFLGNYIYWNRFCQGMTTVAYCDANQKMDMVEAIYGSFACSGENARAKLTSFPTCGKYVTSTMKSLCGEISCAGVAVNAAIFGTTNCGGGEALYLQYDCCK